MSEADKMFKELGYDKQEHGNGDILYYQLNGLRGQNGISFWNSSKEIYPACYGGKHKQPIYITMQELQAINQKVKELGWLDNTSICKNFIPKDKIEILIKDIQEKHEKASLFERIIYNYTLTKLKQLLGEENNE